MTDFPACYVVPPGASVTIGDPGLKASQHSTGGALSVFETSIGAGPPLHVHDHEDECFYVLDGDLSIRCGSEEFDAARGSFVFLPRGRPHRFWATKPDGQGSSSSLFQAALKIISARSTTPQTTKNGTGSVSCTAFASYLNDDWTVGVVTRSARPPRSDHGPPRNLPLKDTDLADKGPVDKSCT